MIPSHSETNKFTITKTDLAKIEFITSDLGTVIAYEVGFKKGNVYFVKKMEDNSFNPVVKKNYLEAGAGTNMYLETSIKEENTGVIKNYSYLLVLTFD